VLISGEVFGPELEDRAEREKRKILEPIVEAGFGVKSVLLNIIFGVTLILFSHITHCLDRTLQGLHYSGLHNTFQV
jgi:hypothetical protein